jgi:hypothetical protein
MRNKYDYNVKKAFTQLLSACLLSCNRVAANRIQLYMSGRQSQILLKYAQLLEQKTAKKADIVALI